MIEKCHGDTTPCEAFDPCFKRGITCGHSQDAARLQPKKVLADGLWVHFGRVIVTEGRQFNSCTMPHCNAACRRANRSRRPVVCTVVTTFSTKQACGPRQARQGFAQTYDELWVLQQCPERSVGGRHEYPEVKT